MRIVALFLVLLIAMPAQVAVGQSPMAPACPRNQHFEGGGCICNTGYARDRRGQCELKKADFTPTVPDRKDKAPKPP